MSNIESIKKELLNNKHRNLGLVQFRQDQVFYGPIAADAVKAGNVQKWSMSHQVKVIGLGFPRTGTRFLRKVLQEYLGFKKTFHSWDLKIFNLAPNKDLNYFYNASISLDENPLNYINWDEYFKKNDYDSASGDTPICLHWRSLMHYYPNCKFILTIRNEEKWFNSLQTLVAVSNVPVVKIMSYFNEFKVRFENHFEVGCKWKELFNYKFRKGTIDKVKCIKSYNCHNNAIMRCKELKHRLFIYNLEHIDINKQIQQFEDLANFLKPCLENEDKIIEAVNKYKLSLISMRPNVNNGSSLKRQIQKAKTVYVFFFFVGILIVVFMILFLSLFIQSI